MTSVIYVSCGSGRQTDVPKRGVRCQCQVPHGGVVLLYGSNLSKLHR